MKAVLLGLALVGLASWGSHQLDPQHGLDIEAMVRAQGHAPTLAQGRCLARADAYWVVACDSKDALLRAVKKTESKIGSDCPQPQTTSLIRSTDQRTGDITYWCMANVS